MNSSLKRTVFRTGIEETSQIAPLKLSATITALYIVLISLYIWFSGKLAQYVAYSIEDLATIELIKGLLFVCVSGTILFTLSYRVLKKIKSQDDRIIAQNKSIIASERLVTAGLFTSSVCHDINNIMTIIIGNTDILQASANLSAEDRESLKEIRTASMKLNALSKRMRESGREYIPGNLEPLNFSELICDTIEFSQRHIKMKGCTITQEIEDGIILNANSPLVGRALMNLLLNASDATNESGTILVRLHQQNHSVSLEVHDDGPGINGTSREKIFEPFFTSKSTGNGLGLLSLKICASQHQAGIIVSQSHLGGACFQLTIPNTSAQLELSTH